LSKRHSSNYNTKFKKYKQEINNKKLIIKCSQLFYFVIEFAICSNHKGLPTFAKISLKNFK